ncbi:rhea isoform b [Anaeramoeba ignava]|uniref:Rhea isoform b n=1 Tax=Anaeramoeba ignava TaxID=1746090 RepID=A0A9Q0LGJ6_ANAIG|nr:rhea isoform b [Anaeramoeba ignava]
MSLSLRVIFNEKKFNKKMKFKSESKGSEVKEMIGKKITKNFDTKNYHLFIPHEKEGEFIPGEWIKETETLSSYGLINGSIIELKTFLIKIRVKTLSNTENILDINLQENVSNVISQIHKELSLPNPIEYYSLAKCGEFEYETKVLEKSKTLFEQDVCDGSAIIKCVESFYFEKFDQSFNEGDALTTRFECFRKNILSGNHLVGLDDALNFAALEMQIQIGNHDEKKHKPSFIKPKLYLSPLWVLVEGIEKDLIHAHSLIVGMSEKVAKERFVFHVYATKPFSTNFYNTKELVSKKKYKPFVVGITPEALIKYTEDRKTILSIIKIIDIKRFATTINSITFHYLNRAEKFQSFQFFCDQIMEIEELVKNYLSAAVKKKKANLLIQKQIDSQGKTESEYKPSQNKSHKLITESSKYQLEKLKESQNEVIQQSDIGFTNTQINQEILHSTQQLQDISFVSKSNITTRRDRDEFMTSNINEENQNSQPTDYSTISNDLDMSQLLSQKIDSNDLNAFISSKPNTSGNQFQSDYGISKPEQAFMSGNFQSEFETSNIENLMSTNYSEFTSQFGVADPQQISSPNLTTQQETKPNPQFIPQLPHDFSPHNKFDPSPLDFSTQSIEDLLKSDLTTMNQNQNQNQNQSNQTLQFMKTKIQSDLEKANSQTDIQQDPRLTTTALNSFLNTNYLNTTRINPIELNSTIMRSANFVKSFSIFVQIPESNEQSVHIGNVSTFIVNNSVNNLPQEINIREFLSKDSKFQIPNEYIVLNELANNTFIAFTKSQSKLQPNFENYKTRLSFFE